MHDVRIANIVALGMRLGPHISKITKLINCLSCDLFAGVARDSIHATRTSCHKSSFLRQIDYGILAYSPKSPSPRFSTSSPHQDRIKPTHVGIVDRRCMHTACKDLLGHVHKLPAIDISQSAEITELLVLHHFRVFK